MGQSRLTLEQATAHIMDLFWQRPELLTQSERAAMVIIKEIARLEEELRKRDK
jgi:hypothetical protein